MQAWAFEHPYLTFTLVLLALITVASSVEAIAKAIGKRCQ
jgi:hypothetical protein